MLTIVLRWHGPAITPPPFDAVQIDAVEQHLQVGGTHGDAAVGAEGEAKGALFEPLVPDREAVLIPIEQLDAIGPLVAKDEQVAGKWIRRKLLPDQLREAIERFAQVGGPGGQPDLNGGR